MNSGLTWEKRKMDLCMCAYKQEKPQVKQKAEQKRKGRNPARDKSLDHPPFPSFTEPSKGTSLLLSPTYVTTTKLNFA